MVLLVAAAAVAAIAVAGYWHAHATAKLSEKDTVVLADFTNTTGDSVFDGTLRQGLEVQLEQSPFLSLLTEERIQQTLKLMEQSPSARLTRLAKNKFPTLPGPSTDVYGASRTE